MLGHNEFTVEGKGEFPLDMLRYDACAPVTEEGRALVDARSGDPLLETPANPDSGKRARLRRYRVTLRTTNPDGSPHTKRWESFGWKVVEASPTLRWAELSEGLPGRPRVHAEGTTAAGRARASEARRAGQGGARVTVGLSPEANAALRELRELDAPASTTDLVERLLLEEVARRAAVSPR